MLILTCRPGQRITFGDGIVVTVTAIAEGKRVSLGIEAPRETKILRGELAEELRVRPAPIARKDRDAN